MRLSHMLTVAALALAAATPAFAQDLGKVGFEFSDADLDGDDALSVDELAKVLPAPAGAATARQLIAVVDKDRDGKASIAELSNGEIHSAKSVVTPEIAIMADFADADLNSDGKVTLAELDAKDASPFASLHEVYVKGADKNGDGGVSKAEWDAERPTMTFTSETYED